MFLKCFIPHTCGHMSHHMFMWDKACCLVLDEGSARNLKTFEAVLLNQCRLLGWNFTQLSLSSKTQCYVTGTVTRGSGFTGCCHTKRNGLLLWPWHHTGMSRFNSVLWFHYCISAEVKHVTRGRPPFVRLTLVAWLIIQTNVLYLEGFFFFTA